MNDNIKNKFDALEALQKRAWETYQSRINFEWKISIALWTALSAFIGISISQDILLPHNSFVQILVIIISLLIVLLHIYFIVGIAHAHHVDRELEFFYRGKMWELSDSTPTKRDNVYYLIEDRKELKGYGTIPIRKIKSIFEKIIRNKKDNDEPNNKEVRKGSVFSWSYIFQVSITILLCIIVIMIFLTKPQNESTFFYEILRNILLK